MILKSHPHALHGILFSKHRNCPDITILNIFLIRVVNVHEGQGGEDDLGVEGDQSDEGGKGGQCGQDGLGGHGGQGGLDGQGDY